MQATIHPLRHILKSNDTVYVVSKGAKTVDLGNNKGCDSVRENTYYVIKNDKPLDITAAIAGIIGVSMGKYGGLVLRGLDMDLNASVVREVSRALFGNEEKLVQVWL